MANPILEALGKTAMGTVQNNLTINPAMIAKAKSVLSIPGRMSTIMKFIGGRDPQKLFYELCSQRGVDPENILNQLR